MCNASRMRRLGLILPILLLTMLSSSFGASENPQPILQGGFVVEVVEIAPAGRSKDPGFVRNRTWRWVGTITPVEKITVPDPGRYTIRLTDDGKVQARFDCNRGGGAYDISEGKVTFGPLMSTRMACPADSLDGPFMRDLQRVASFFVQDGELYLELPFDSGTMRFRQGPPG